jgi:hypothetical protein
LINQVANCLVCGIPLTPNAAYIYQFISIKWVGNSWVISFNPRSYSEVKLTLKEVRLAKRGISNVKRQIMEAKRVKRAKFTESIRKHDKFKERWLYAPSPAVRRKILADDLAPLEAEQRALENLRIQVEQCIVQLESWLMNSENQ